MRFVIQKPGTGLFFGRGLKWTANATEALAFIDETRARDFSIYNRLGSTTVSILADQPRPGLEPVTLPVRFRAASIATLNLSPMKTTSVKPAKPTKPKPATTVARAGSRKPSVVAAKPPARPRNGKPSTRRAASKAQPDLESAVPVPAPTGRALVQAKIDVGLGNILFIRGQGAGLSWDTGKPLTCVDGSTWIWSAPPSMDRVQFKLLLNDQVWCQGDDLTAEKGRTTELTPVFG
ncbi:MAG: hypothetical protein ACYDC1_13270 [Limisphaerales bacterium]